MEEGFAALGRYKEAEGNCKVSGLYKTADGFNLGSWLTTQRVAYNKGPLPEDRVRRLKDLGALN